MATKRKKHDGRASDLTFSWMLTTLGTEWQQWQELAAGWMEAQTTAISLKQAALTRFFEQYLMEYAPYAIGDLSSFFNGCNEHKSSSEEIESMVRKIVSHPQTIQESINYPCDFIDFVIEKVFSEEDDNGNLVPLVQNPLSKIKRQVSATETVRNPLPYRYIQDLRQILYPLPDKTELSVIEQNLKGGETLLPAYHYRHFKDWKWAHEHSGDWFDALPELIDKDDPDCVWRTKEVTRNNKKSLLTKSGRPLKRW
jgi:hypothetical protein